MVCYTSEVGFSEFMTNYVLRNSHSRLNYRSDSRRTLDNPEFTVQCGNMANMLYQHCVKALRHLLANWLYWQYCATSTCARVVCVLSRANYHVV